MSPRFNLPLINRCSLRSLGGATTRAKRCAENERCWRRGERGGEGNNKTGARSSSTSLSRAPEGSHSFSQPLFYFPVFFISSPSLVSPFFILLLRYQCLVFRTFNVVQFFLSFLLEIVLSKTIVTIRANCCQIIDVGKNGEERRLASFFARWDATLAGQFEKQTEGNA